MFGKFVGFPGRRGSGAASRVAPFVGGPPGVGRVHGLPTGFWTIRAAILVVAMFVMARAEAQMSTGVSVVPLGYCQLTPTSATALSACSGGIPATANMIMMTADTATVRWRDDGTAPTTTTGLTLIFAQQPFLYTGTLSKLQFISATGILNVSFYRAGAP